jgi:hypothetical protein
MVGGKDVTALRRYILKANDFNACQQPDKYGNDKGYTVSQHGMVSQALIVALNTKNLKSSGNFSVSIYSGDFEDEALPAYQTRKHEMRV